MPDLSAAASLPAVVLTSLLLVRLLRPRGAAEWVVFLFPVGTGLVMAYGYLLSAANAIARPPAWLAVAVFGLVVAAVANRLLCRRLPLPDAGPAPAAADAPPRRAALLLGLLGGTAAVVLGLHLAVVLCTAPHNYDSMTCHLTRVAYFLQHGNLETYPACYWAETMHPRNHAILLLYAYLVGGENLTQGVQLAACLVLAWSVYGTARRAGAGPRAAAAGALVSLLLIDVLMESVTTQNDLLIAAYAGVAAYGLAAFRAERAPRYLWLAGAAAGLMLGVKAAAVLTAPPLLLLLARAVWPATDWTRRQALGTAPHLLGAGVLAGLMVLPVGYVENVCRFGHPVGPANLRMWHSFEGVPTRLRAFEAVKNVCRFAVEFLTPDGLPQGPGSAWLAPALKTPPRLVFSAIGLDLEKGLTCQKGMTSQPDRGLFNYNRPSYRNEDQTYFGVLGLGLLWPAVLYAAVRPGNRARAVLAWGALAFVVAQAWAAPYDPFRGRYFTWAVGFAGPVLATCLGGLLRSRAGCAGAFVVALLGCGSALAAVAYRDDGGVMASRAGVGGHLRPGLFATDRLGQLTSGSIWYADALRRYEEMVPAHATVAVSLEYQYPFFGAGLTRKLVPVLPYAGDPSPGAGVADFLVFTERWMPPREGDVHLGEDIYLRRLR